MLFNDLQVRPMESSQRARVLVKMNNETDYKKFQAGTLRGLDS